MLNTHECARQRKTSGTLTALGTIFNETAKEEPFISKLNEINCGSFSYFSLLCVFHILSPIFTETKHAPQKRSYTVGMKLSMNVLGCSRMFCTFTKLAITTG